MCFLFNDTATTEIYTLSLHDALPIYQVHDPLRDALGAGGDGDPPAVAGAVGVAGRVVGRAVAGPGLDLAERVEHGDRKSTRLNSSHANISYAVFCLKKKKKNWSDSSL